MKFDFLESLALFMLHNQSTSILPNIAVHGLEEGYKSPSLILLAGLQDNENPFVITEHFKKSLEELNINFRDKNQAALFLVKSLVDKVLKDDIDVYKACEYIFENILPLADFRTHDKKFVYDSIGLSDIYSLYITAEELTQASIKWDKLKTNEQILNEIKEEIKMKLKQLQNLLIF